MTLALDGSVNGTIAAGSSGSVSLTTANTNDVIIVSVITANGTTASVSDAAGLTWTQRLLATNTANTYEFYAISANALSADSITVTLSATDNAVIVAFGVSGASTSSPFDGNGTTATGSGTAVSGSYTTANNGDFLIGIVGVYNATDTITAGSGFTIIQQTNIAKTRGKLRATLGDEYEVLSTTGSQTVSATLSASNSWMLLIDAVSPPVTAFSKSLSDTLSLTDEQIIDIVKVVYSDSISLSETFNAVLLLKTSLSDSLSLIDVNAILLIKPLLKDVIDLSESYTYYLKYNLSVDTLSLNEVFIFKLLISLLNTVGLGELLTLQPLLVLKDVIDLTDTYTYYLKYILTNDTLNLTETFLLKPLVLLTDDFYITDTITKTASILTSTDTINLIDKNISAIFVQLLSLSDSLLLTDNTIIYTDKKQVAETLNLIEAALKTAITTTMKDILSLTDYSALLYAYFVQSFSESLSLTDNPISAAILKLLNLTDSLVITSENFGNAINISMSPESIGLNVGVISTIINVTLTNIISLSEAFSTLLHTPIQTFSLSDSLSLGDMAISAVFPLRSVIIHALTALGIPTYNISRIKSLDINRFHGAVVIPKKLGVKLMGFQDYWVNENYLIVLYSQNREEMDDWRNIIENNLTTYISADSTVVNAQYVPLVVSTEEIDYSYKVRGIYQAFYHISAQLQIK